MLTRKPVPLQGSPSIRRQRILCVHQGFELYGSDRMFLQTVHVLRREFPEASIRVILPRVGPLYDKLREIDCTISIQILFIARKGMLRQLSSPFLWRDLFRGIHQAKAEMDAADLVYINTCVVLDYLLASRLRPSRMTICHVHEIPIGWELYVFRSILRWARVPLIFNSSASRRAFAPSERVGVVIHNGTDEPTTVPEPPSCAGRPLRLLLIGRINSWKGQDLLVKALSRMADPSQVSVRIVGSSFGDDPSEQKLADMIMAAGLRGVVERFGFESNPDTHYDWADVVVVPSRRPEPFGLVAIEAMARRRSVIAAKHGGITEIVRSGENGLLFRPNDSTELYNCIADLIHNPGKVRDFAEKARADYLDRFTSESYCSRVATYFHAFWAEKRLKWM